MWKEWGYPLDSRKNDLFQGDSKSSYNSIEAFEIRDNLNFIDLIRPIRNVFEDAKDNYLFKQTSTAAEMGNEAGIFKHSINWAFSGDTNDIMSVKVNPGTGDTYRYFSRIKPGIAYMNGNLVISRPTPWIAERQIAQILKLNDWKDESVSIKYFINTDLYQAKVLQRDYNGIPQPFYFTNQLSLGTTITGDSAKWGDSRYGYRGAIKLFEAMHQTWPVLFRLSLADSIYRIFCEPCYKLPLKWNGDTIYWKIDSTGRVYGDSKPPLSSELPLQAYRFQVVARAAAIIGGSRGDSRRYIQNIQDFPTNIYLNTPLYFGDTSSYSDSMPWADSQGMKFVTVANRNAGLVVYNQNAGKNNSATFFYMKDAIPGVIPSKSGTWWANKDIIASRWVNAGDTLGRAWASLMSLSGDSWTFWGTKLFNSPIVLNGVKNYGSDTLINGLTVAKGKLWADSGIKVVGGDTVWGGLTVATGKLVADSGIIVADSILGIGSMMLLPTSSSITLGSTVGSMTWRGDTLLSKSTTYLFPNPTTIKIGSLFTTSSYQNMYLGSDTVFLTKGLSGSMAVVSGALRITGSTQQEGAFYGGTTNPAHSDRANYDGVLYALQFQTTSNRENKTNIKPFKKNALDLINQVKVVEFNFKFDSEKKYNVGFVAEDTHEILSGKNHDMMDMNNTLGILIKAVQDLDKKVEKLKKGNAELKNKVRVLETKVRNAPTKTKRSNLTRIVKR